MQAAQDVVLHNDWHPVAAGSDLVPGKLVPSRLLGQDVVIARTTTCQITGLRYPIGSPNQLILFE